LVDVEVAKNRGMGLVRITVDHPSGDGRVEIERCVAISREVETLLDAADQMMGAYKLEVTSPGLDRVLGRDRDFVAVIGHEIKLRVGRPIEGRKRFRGQLVSFESGALNMKVDGGSVLIPIEDVEKANLIYEFTSADFAKGAAHRNSSQSGGE